MQAGKIHNLQRQREFILIPPKKGEYRNEKKCSYFADFVYEKNGKLVVEDFKSPATKEDEVYKIKRKLMLQKYDISIREVFHADDSV